VCGALLASQLSCLQSEESDLSPVPEADRGLIRENVIGLMLTTQQSLRPFLSESVAAISRVDFPARWPLLISGLAAHAASTDLATLVGVMETAVAVFERFDGQPETEEVILALKLCLDSFLEPFLACTKFFMASAGTHLSHGAASIGPLKLSIRGLQLVAECLFFLSYPVLADALNEKLPEIIPALEGVLKYVSTGL
jgi:exportin-2 (importin alpha re-exporter)